MIIRPGAPRARQVPARARVLTGHPRAARALGVPHLSPARHAGRVLLASGGTIASRLTGWRTLAEAIREVHGDVDVTGRQRVLASPVRELLRVGLDLFPDDVPVSQRAGDALRVARLYRARLAERGEVDAAEIFWVAARASQRPSRLAILAVRELGPDACAFVDAAAGPGSVLVVAPEEEAATRSLADRGWLVQEESAGAATALGVGAPARAAAPDAASAPVTGVPGTGDGAARDGERWALAFAGDGGDALRGEPGAVAYGFASQRDEIRWVLARVKQMLCDGVPAGEVVLAARDDAAVSDLVEALAWEADVPVRVSHGVRLADTRLGGWLGGLREVVSRDLPYEETARLLAHRATGGLPTATWRAVRERHPEGAEAWQALDPRAAALAWPREDAAAGWAARLDATLAAFGLDDEAALEPRDAAVLRTLREAVADACRPGERVLPLRAFLTDLEDLLTLMTVRKDPRPGPNEPATVELVALHTLTGARVPHLFVLGAFEGGLPAALRDDPVLDFADRAWLAAAGVPVARAADRARAEEGAFLAMLRAVDGSLTLTVPARVEGRVTLPSPYLGRLGLRPLPAPDLPPASAVERRRRVLQHGEGPDPLDPVLESARHGWRIERRREGVAPADRHDGVGGRARDPASERLSATQIVELGQCPFRWFAHRVLDLRESDEAEEVVSPRLRGTLWHATLERAVRSGVHRAGVGADGASLRAAILAALPQAFADAEEDVGVPAVPAWRKARESELRALARAVRADDFITPGAVPVAFERAFRGHWRGLRVAGVVDRIDAGPDGAVLIDYKSGTRVPKGAKDAGGRGWTDVQLPLYLEAAAPELVPGEPRVAARYLSLRSGETIGEARPGANDAALDELAERVRRHLASGSFPVDPDARKLACDSCELAAVCRVGPRVDRKRDAAREARRESEGTAEVVS